MHNKITKAVTASLMAAAMLTTTVATIAAYERFCRTGTW